MSRKLHAPAGIIGFLLILSFWSATVISELSGSAEAITTVKTTIVWGMLALVPSLALAGASGMAIGRRRRDAPVLAKKKRMPFIAANGVLVLIPSAVFLAAKAGAGTFDGWFYSVQAIELIAGAVNLSLMGLNIRDGLKMSRRRKQAGNPDASAKI